MDEQQIIEEKSQRSAIRLVVLIEVRASSHLVRLKVSPLTECKWFGLFAILYFLFSSVWWNSEVVPVVAGKRFCQKTH